jgi:hypothetical protein
VSSPDRRFRSCELDKQKLRPCTSPKTYKELAPGRHVFRVKARDGAGNVDATPGGQAGQGQEALAASHQRECLREWVSTV